MIDERSPIGSNLARVTDLLRQLQVSVGAQVDTIMNVADDPRPVLKQLAGTLRLQGQKRSTRPSVPSSWQRSTRARAKRGWRSTHRDGGRARCSWCTAARPPAWSPPPASHPPRTPAHPGCRAAADAGLLGQLLLSDHQHPHGAARRRGGQDDSLGMLRRPARWLKCSRPTGLAGAGGRGTSAFSFACRSAMTSWRCRGGRTSYATTHGEDAAGRRAVSPP